MKLLLSNSIDTNLISIFIPEIWNAKESEFVDRDENGKVSTNSTFPCEIFISAFKEPPVIAFTKEAFTLKAYIKIAVDCKNVNDELKRVVEIETSTDMAYKVTMTDDLLVRMEVQNF